MTDTSRRFSGLDRLYGEHTAEHLKHSHVCVVGVGGVGSWAVEALARCGVGQLTLIDADHVVESNVNRQVQATTDNLGKAKITALTERIASINPDCRVVEIDEFIDETNLSLLPTDAIILDCTDQINAKFAMIIECKRRRQPLLTCGAAGGKTDATRIQIADLSQSIQDPILAKIRQKLRAILKTNPTSKNKTVKKLNVAVLYSDEAIRYPSISTCDTESAPQGLNCAGFGSSVMVTASFGMTAAQWAIAQQLKSSK
ncbi:tRNA threonylcarbamoyladenosine dehydratase [Formosimonas limnophila]|uniref:tRNA threonylcarbamoyladenosine dehydratase n=1 Tax=Formosimonas limnophila TaxID=1384487 RepID=A0A8J3FZH5_9BURK|nr:tRNA threonylcarbamoyladenosine dehydratase [Formosimonas limnophila]GHA68519.1 tRNA threonylcarbamoyladenosine dehydratase [Formosimonas limnophila]